jgi:hypothetical protein
VFEIAESPAITEEWLREVGFKWHQLERQPGKHWLLWVGDLCGKHTTYEDLGIELALVSFTDPTTWHCWLRADTSSRYSRFLHVRYLRTQDELTRLFEGLTGCAWNASNHFGGTARTPDAAARIRAERERLDLRMLHEGQPWRSIETDNSRGRPLPEHLQAHEESKGRA